MCAILFTWNILFPVRFNEYLRFYYPCYNCKYGSAVCSRSTPPIYIRLIPAARCLFAAVTQCGQALTLDGLYTLRVARLQRVAIIIIFHPVGLNTHTVFGCPRPARSVVCARLWVQDLHIKARQHYTACKLHCSLAYNQLFVNTNDDQRGGGERGGGGVFVAVNSDLIREDKLN